MLRLIEGFSAGMSARWNGCSFSHKSFIAVLLAASVAGCSLVVFKGFEFSDPKKAVLFAYLRHDKNSAVEIMYLRDVSRKDDDDTSEIIGIVYSTEDDPCVLFAGTVNMGTYEIHGLSGQQTRYIIDRKTPGNIRLKVSKPDTYFVGQFQLAQVDEAGFMKNGTFSFTTTTGCPNEKTAIRTVLKDERHRSTLDGTPWYDKLVKKMGK